MKSQKWFKSTRHGDMHLPFANEDEVQEFVVRYFENIFGLTVISSSLPGGGRLFKFDVLAVDHDNTPYIIECKDFQVRSDAIQQLLRYEEVLQSNRLLFEQRLGDLGRKVVGKRRKPVLVAIGYRYEPSVLREAKEHSIVCLTYTYHDVTPYVYRHATPKLRVVKQRRLGKVSIHFAQQMSMPSPHPKICKKRSAMKRLADLSPDLQREFKKINRALCGLHPVWIAYGGKGLVRYQVLQGKFAEARIDKKEKSIHWSYPKSAVWRDGEPWDSKEMLKACCTSHARLTLRKRGEGRHN